MTVRLADGRRIEALSFLSDRTHPQWAGVLSLERQAELIAGATRALRPQRRLPRRPGRAPARSRASATGAMETLLAMVLRRAEARSVPSRVRISQQRVRAGLDALLASGA